MNAPVALIAVLASALAIAPPQEVKRDADPSKVALGAPFTYRIAISHPKAQRYELKAPGDLGAFDMVGVERTRKDEGEQATTTFAVKLALFELGDHVIPPLTFEVVEPGGEGTQTVEGISVEGIGTLPEGAEKAGAAMADLKPPIDLPVRTWRLVYAALAVLATLGLGYALWRWLRNRQAAPIPVPPPKPLNERTRAALDALRREGLVEKGEVKAFYFRLSEIVRGHLGERYGFEALESTSQELFEALEKRSTPGLPKDALRRFTDEADFVKFAKGTADAAQCEAALAFGYQLVDLTTPTTPPIPIDAPPPPAA